VALAGAPVGRLWITVVIFNAINAAVYALVYRRTDLWQKSIAEPAA
jgi:hypothetical protein